MSESPEPSEVGLSQSAALPRSFTAEQKAQWAQKFLESGLSIRKFSQQHNVPRMSLWRWVAGARGVHGAVEEDSGSVGFEEIKLAAPPAGNSGWAAELTLPNGTVLRMSKEVPPGMVDQLLRLC